MFIPTWGNDPIWLLHMFQLDWFNLQLDNFEKGEADSDSFVSLAYPDFISLFLSLISLLSPKKVKLFGRGKYLGRTKNGDQLVILVV